MESFSYLTCIITTALLFVNPQHRTNFFGQNCTYFIRTDARQTNQSGHRRKNLAFFCACSAITQHHAKKKQVFFSQKICSCSTITYNFFLCLRGYSLLPVRFPFHKFTSHFYFLADPGIVLNKISQHGCCLHSAGLIIKCTVVSFGSTILPGTPSPIPAI